MTWRGVEADGRAVTYVTARARRAREEARAMDRRDQRAPGDETPSRCTMKDAPEQGAFFVAETKSPVMDGAGYSGGSGRNAGDQGSSGKYRFTASSSQPIEHQLPSDVSKRSSKVKVRYGGVASAVKVTNSP